MLPLSLKEDCSVFTTAAGKQDTCPRHDGKLQQFKSLKKENLQECNSLFTSGYTVYVNIIVNELNDITDVQLGEEQNGC